MQKMKEDIRKGNGEILQKQKDKLHTDKKKDIYIREAYIVEAGSPSIICMWDYRSNRDIEAWP